jgi:glycogen operon protein
VDGPQDLHGAGYRYNKNKVLIDPYARGNTTALWQRGDATGPGENLATSMRSVVIDTGGYDWAGTAPSTCRCKTRLSMNCTSAALPGTGPPA